MALAVIFEVAFASSLGPSNGLTRPWPTISVVVFAIAAVLALAKATQSIPTTTSYVTFVGLGTVGTSVVAVVFQGERLDVWRVLSIALVIVGAVGLHLTGDAVT